MNDETPKPQADAPRLPAIQNRIITAAAAIQEDDPLEIVYQHSLFCQIALPRSRPKERVFERSYRNGSVRMRAGACWNGQQWLEQPLPAGPKPRLALMHLHDRAIKTHSPYVEIGHSCAEFLRRLGLNDQDGRTYRLFKREMQALAACHMTLGFTEGEQNVTLDAKPITRFEAWVNANDDRSTFWPGHLQLSWEYFESLRQHAVPLDTRAVSALAHSALAMDAYSFFARRLYTLTQPVKVFWRQWQEQFGQEYTGPDAIKNFKKEWLAAVRAALTVYPSAKVELVKGGLLLKPSLPPVHPKAVAVSHGLAHQVRQSLPAPKSIKPETVERFRALYPRRDPYACEADFKAWVETKEPPRDFDKAFLGFAKKWGQSRG